MAAAEQKTTMPHVNLGKTGLKVSQVIYGCMSLGSSDWQEWILDEEAALPLLEHAYRAGITTWDTADVYSHGRSEEIIGRAIAKYAIPREELVILTKCCFGVASDGSQPAIAAVGANEGAWTNRTGLSRKHILAAVDASVRRLGGSYIDVLQIHRLDRSVPREEIMRALNDVVEAGKVRYLGASSMAAWEFQALQNIAERNGWHKFVSMQNYYNLIYREEEREMIPYCKDTGVGLIPWSPVARGALTRPWAARDTLREKTDRTLANLVRSRESAADEAIIGRIEEVATKRGISMTAVATAWCIAKGTIPIVGLNSKERIDQAVQNANVKLSQEDIDYLEEKYIPKLVQGY